MKPPHTGYLTFLTTLAFLSFSVSALAGKPDKCETWPHCDGGDGGNDSGTDIKLSCTFSNETGSNVLGVGGAYTDGEQKVTCDTGGTSQPNLSGINLDTIAKGNIKRAIRKLNLEFGYCSDANCIKPDGSAAGPDNTGKGDLPDGLFNAELEDVHLSVRPYRHDISNSAPDGQDHIQSLDPGVYPMAVRINIKDYDPRIVINIAGHSVLGDKFQGVLCDIPDQGLATTSDVNVIVFGADENGHQAFTITTNAVNGWIVDPASNPVRAAICSDIPVDGVLCGGPGDSQVCNFHGLVDVKFTLDTIDVNSL